MESIRNEIEDIEYWSARDLQELFDYKEWRNFEKTIEKAMISYKNKSETLHYHFVESNKLIEHGKGDKEKSKIMYSLVVLVT